MTFVFLTGYSGSGKSTIAAALSNVIDAPVLDGDQVRQYFANGHIQGINGQKSNLEALIEVATTNLNTHPLVIGAFVSPNKELRQQMVQEIEKHGYRVLIVHAKASIETCMKRDPKGLYKKLENGESIHLAGVNCKYDEPESPALVCETDGKTVKQCTEEIMGYLKENGFAGLL